jgi:hypothetical protein
MSAYDKLVAEKVYGAGQDDIVDEEDLVAAYDVRIGETTFLQLYLTTFDYTLAWPGAIDQFKYSNDNASHFIDKQLRILREGMVPYDTNVIFIISRKIHKFRLRSFEPVLTGIWFTCITQES